MLRAGKLIAIRCLQPKHCTHLSQYRRQEPFGKYRSGATGIRQKSARFELNATTNRGEARNEFGSPIQTETEGQGATLKGKVGPGPVITITNARGAVTVKKR